MYGLTKNNVAVCCVGMFLILYRASYRIFGPYTHSLMMTFKKEGLAVTKKGSSLLQTL